MNRAKNLDEEMGELVIDEESLCTDMRGHVSECMRLASGLRVRTSPNEQPTPSRLQAPMQVKVLSELIGEDPLLSDARC